MLKELLKDHETGMTKFQDDYFVTGKSGITLYGQYKQSLRELYKRFRGLRELTFNRKRLDVDIAEAKYNSIHAESDFDRQRAQIDSDEKTALIEESERVINDTKREFTNFYNQAVALKKQLGRLTKKKCEQLEKEMWAEKAVMGAACDMLTKGRIAEGTLDLIISFPKEMRSEVLLKIKNHDKIISELENIDTDFISSSKTKPALKMTDVMKQLEG